MRCVEGWRSHRIKIYRAVSCVCMMALYLLRRWGNVRPGYGISYGHRFAFIPVQARHPGCCTVAPSHSGVKAPLQKPWQQRLSDPCLMQFSTYNIGPISTFFRCEASLLVGVSVVRPSVTNSWVIFPHMVRWNGEIQIFQKPSVWF